MYGDKWPFCCTLDFEFLWHNLMKTLKLLEFETLYNLKTIFLEYGSFCAKITNYLNWKDIAERKRCIFYLQTIDGEK